MTKKKKAVEQYTDKAKGTIHVLYALMDKDGHYSKFAGVSLCSVWENTASRVTAHVFHDGSVKGDNRENFEAMAKRYGQEITFYNVKELLEDTWQEARRIFPDALDSERYTAAALYRLVAHRVLPSHIKRVIYLDADTVVHMDIKRLWEEVVGEAGLAAVREDTALKHYDEKLGVSGQPTQPIYAELVKEGLKLEDHFNSGVLLMDLARLRVKGDILLDGLNLLAGHPGENEFYDQIILNYYFSGSLTPLPWQYNIMVGTDKQRRPNIGEPEQGIYHYMGGSLGFNGKDPRDVMFFDYFVRTPWANGEFICRLYSAMRHKFIFSLAPHIGKTRKLAVALRDRLPVFAVSDECAGSIKKDKALRYLALGAEGSGMKLSLPYDVESHCYLFFVKDYKKLCRDLEEAGLKEGVHFMDGSFLLRGAKWLSTLFHPYEFWTEL